MFESYNILKGLSYENLKYKNPGFKSVPKSLYTTLNYWMYVHRYMHIYMRERESERERKRESERERKRGRE